MGEEVKNMMGPEVKETYNQVTAAMVIFRSMEGQQRAKVAFESDI